MLPQLQQVTRLGRDWAAYGPGCRGERKSVEIIKEIAEVETVGNSRPGGDVVE
jgi:hypothetical protein